MNYWLKHNLKRLIGISLLALSVYLLSKTSLQKTAVSLLVISMMMIIDKPENLFKDIISLLILIIFLASTWFWWIESPFLGKIITDMMMLIIVTMIYVLFTYLILESNRTFFDISRMPLLIIGRYTDSITIFNEDNKHVAKNLKVEIELIYPIPKTLCEHIAHKFKRIFRNYFHGYQIKYEISELLPGRKKYLSFSDFLELQLSLKEKKSAEGDIIPFSSEEPIKFRLDVTLTFKTDTGHTIPQEIKDNLYFTCDNKGCEFEDKESKLERIK